MGGGERAPKTRTLHLGGWLGVYRLFPAQQTLVIIMEFMAELSWGPCSPWRGEPLALGGCIVFWGVLP